jgi:hypothetical protein
MTDAEFREAYESHKDLLFRFACRMMASAEAAEDFSTRLFPAPVA